MLAPILKLIAGAALALFMLWDAFETVLVPRRIGRRVRFTRWFYLVTWRVWRAFARRVRQPSRREAVLGVFAPLSLILLLACWASGLIAAFALMQQGAVGLAGQPLEPFGKLLYLSGETFFTLGFGDITPTTRLGRGLSVLEAGLGFAFLGTVIGYLPTLYGAFSEREIAISMLDARAGSPPTAAEFLARSQALGGDAMKQDALRDWERWAAQLLETHISYPLLAYYRSQHVNQSWLSTLTTILDSCVLVLAGSDPTSKPQAKLTFAMARHALVDIMQLFIVRRPPSAPDRLPAAELSRLAAHIGQAESPEHEQRLARLRELYEPYAQALADLLLFELPPWIHPDHRADNWRRAPWDRPIADATGTDEHF
jgi:hypothetical protein